MKSWFSNSGLLTDCPNFPLFSRFAVCPTSKYVSFSLAFANCDGGKLYIGVRDDGTVVGLNNPDEVSLQINNMVRDSIKPDVTMFLPLTQRSAV